MPPVQVSITDSGSKESISITTSQSNNNNGQHEQMESLEKIHEESSNLNIMFTPAEQGEDD